MRSAYKILGGNPEGKRPLGRHRRRCENNIRMNLSELGGEVWTGYIWLRIRTSGWAFVNTVMKFCVP
jgi:hypothetical protein